jgi:plasmid replication initiation protein
MKSPNPSIEKPPRTKATEVKPRKMSEMVKPQELIEMVEMAPLSLASRRIYNLLDKHAWDKLDRAESHTIEKKLLRSGGIGIKTNATERLGQSIEEIMAVVVRQHRGQKLDRFQLLGYNTDDDIDSDNALFHYTFPEPLRKIIRLSEVWARLESHVIYAFSSKYALALYELVALRANLKHKTSEVFELEKFRALIGVEPDKLLEFKNLKKWAVEGALREVNGLCPDFNVKVEGVMTGRKVTAIKVTWWGKSAAEKAAALREITGSRVGRRERLTGTAETIVEPPKVESTKPRPALAHRQPYNTNLTADDIEEAKKLAPKYDIYNIESEWRSWVAGRGIDVKSPRSHFLAFVKNFVKSNPL